MAFRLPHAIGPKRIEQRIDALTKLYGTSDLSLLDDEEILQEYEQDMSLYGIPDHLEIHPIEQEPLLGKGVFLCPEDDPIEKNEFIAIYSGEYKFLTDEDAFDGSYTFEVLSIKAKGKKREKLNALGFSLDETVDEVFLYVDALKKGNYARYINNSSHPNVEAVIELVRGKPEVVYRACRRIYPGEQLLVDYTESYWEPMGIKPLSIESDSFMLNKKGKIVTGSEFYMDKAVRDRLVSMTSVHPGTLRKKGERLTPSLKKKINEFEKQLYKEHIDPRMYVKRENGKYRLRLRPGKKIKKGSFVGLYSPNNFFKYALHSKNNLLFSKNIFDESSKRNYIALYANVSLDDTKQISVPKILPQ